MESTFDCFILDILWNEYVVELRILVKPSLLSIPQVELYRHRRSITLIDKPTRKVWNEVLLDFTLNFSLVYQYRKESDECYSLMIFLTYFCFNGIALKIVENCVLTAYKFLKCSGRSTLLQSLPCDVVDLYH